MGQHAERCRTLREHIRMYARMRARGFRPLGKRFGTFGRFGTSGGSQVCWDGLATVAITLPTFAHLALLCSEATTNTIRRWPVPMRTRAIWAGRMSPSRPNLPDTGTVAIGGTTCSVRLNNSME